MHLLDLTDNIFSTDTYRLDRSSTNAVDCDRLWSAFDVHKIDLEIDRGSDRVRSLLIGSFMARSTS